MDRARNRRTIASAGLLSALLATAAFVSGAALRDRPRRSRLQPPQGLWVGPERFRLEAKDWISLHPDGWAVHTCHPGHPFISWELAIRYEAACQEARYRYLKLCDAPTDAEATEHIERIAELLLETERLSRIEQGARPRSPPTPTPFDASQNIPTPLPNSIKSPENLSFDPSPTST